MTLMEIHERYPDEKIPSADGLDDAIIGFDDVKMRIVYSVSKVIDILERDMSREDAMEFFEYNIAGTDIGERTPVWCRETFE